MSNINNGESESLDKLIQSGLFMTRRLRAICEVLQEGHIVLISSCEQTVSFGIKECVNNESFQLFVLDLGKDWTRFEDYVLILRSLFQKQLKLYRNANQLIEHADELVLLF
jgi:hypothetical protein